jgi:small-conductance mechanosensitive channel/CRP-like cAMP-binding protein
VTGWFEISPKDIWAMGGALIAIAVGIAALLFVLLPRDKRAYLRIPLGFLAVYVFLVALRWVLPHEGGSPDWVQVTALFCLLVVIARGLALLFTQTKLAERYVPPVPRIFQDLVQAVLYVIVLLLTMRAAGADPGSLLTTGAIFTAVIGFALQDTLGNMFAGLSIQIQKPFEKGDWIEYERDGRQAGRVLEIGWRTTRLLTLDDVEIVVPNGEIAKASVRNYTKPTVVSRRNIVFGTSYADPPEKVASVALEALADVPLVLKSPEPSVVVTDFGESAVVYTLRYYTDDYHRAIVTDGIVRKRLWYAFRRAGVTIPFPQRDVHLFTHDAAERESLRQDALAARRRALGHVPLFDVLSEEARDELAARSQTRLYASGETVVRQGEMGDELFVVVSGEVAVILEQERDASLVEVARLGAGKFFGEMSLLTGEARAATVRVVREAELVVVGSSAIRALLDRNPELAEKLSAVLAERQLQLEEQRAARRDRASQSAELAQRTTDFVRRIRGFFERSRLRCHAWSSRMDYAGAP